MPPTTRYADFWPHYVTCIDNPNRSYVPPSKKAKVILNTKFRPRFMRKLPLELREMVYSHLLGMYKDTHGGDMNNISFPSFIMPLCTNC